MLTIKLLKTIFKVTGKAIEGAGTLMAGAAMLTSATVMNAITLAATNEKEEMCTTKATVNGHETDVISGKYKIIDENDGFSVIAVTDDFDEAIEWVTEYRMNGRKVRIQRD
jgi:hypothetical protein